MNASILRRLAVVISLYGISSPMAIAAKEATLKSALEASAADLAQAYLTTKTRLAFLDIAVPGITIIHLGETINKDSAEGFRARDEKLLSVYKQAIMQRGYKSFAGAYRGVTTESCARIKSSWVGIVHEREQSGIEITQNGIDAQLILRGKRKDKEVSLENEAAIAESSIAILDAMNSDYLFRGELKDQTIFIKPDPKVLDTWPKWAGPPSRRDLENCTITLTPLSADSRQK